MANNVLRILSEEDYPEASNRLRALHHMGHAYKGVHAESARILDYHYNMAIVCSILSVEEEVEAMKDMIYLASKNTEGES